MIEYYITRHEISGCTVNAKNRAEAMEIAAQLPDETFEREEEADYLWAEMVE